MLALKSSPTITSESVREQIEKVSIKYSISKGLYCELHSDVEVTDEFLKKDPNVSAGIETMVKDNIVVVSCQFVKNDKKDVMKY